eukprot:9805173-Alexandrium_andersonii.AAC.1
MGGLTHHFPKPKAGGSTSGDLGAGPAPAQGPSGCEHRAIILADVIGKTHHKWVRTLMAPHLHSHSLPSQFGGITGRAIDIPTL